MAAPMHAANLEVGNEENQELCQDNTSNKIFTQYELFHRIFRNLPAKTLNTCCMVCKEWRREIQRIKSSRRQMAWMLYKADEQKTSDDFTPALRLSDRIKNLDFEPQQVLLFVSEEMDERGLPLPPQDWRNVECPKAAALPDPALNPRPPDPPSGDGPVPDPKPEPLDLSPAAKRPRPEVHHSSVLEFLQGRLPSSCPVDGIVADGIVGTDELIGAPKELDKYGMNAAAMLFLGEMPGVSIYSFTHEADFDSEVKSTNRADLCKMTGIPEDANVRCVLYWRVDFEDAEESLLWDVIRLTCPDVIIAGGFPEKPIPCDDEETPVVKGLAFCGDDIQVASVNLDARVTSKSDVSEKILQLKDSGIRVDKQSVAFMFSCISRGKHQHGESNVEAAIFKSHFPRVPLFGMFAFTQLGYNHLPDYTNRKDRSEHAQFMTYAQKKWPKVGDMPDVWLSDSTVFVLLSLPGGER